jgi:D-alanyl-D-alanine carboxypeptidase/D-alanyl-D-alanine-endopeptidase (penicillin-binding protein 4)
VAPRPENPAVQGSSSAKVLLLLSGWAVAAWLIVAPRVDPISVSFDSSGKPGPPPKSELEKAFDKWAADPSLDGASIGFCVLDSSGETLYASPLAETALCPASALKTMTTAAALDLLGPEFRFETTLHGTAVIGPDGVLPGDLVLVGGGDPTLSTEDLEAMVAEVMKAGLKQVTGRVTVDASIFPTQAVNDHWNWGDIGNAYGVGAFGVNVNHNRLEIPFDPGAKVGDPATLRSGLLVTKDTRWINRVTTGAAGSGDQVVVYSQPYGRTITLQGTVPLDEAPFTVTGAIPDPPAVVGEYLTKALQQKGVKLLGRESMAAKPAAKLASHQSVPLPEIIDHLHRVSDNLEAQCLFLMIGRLQKLDPVKALRSYWEKRGVYFTGLRLIDGSGLARATMIRPIDLAKVNHVARHGSHGDRFRQSLTAYLDGSVRAKLGAMSGVKTEVGFLTLPDGREVTFALMANGLDPAVNFWPLREQLLRSIR